MLKNWQRKGKIYIYIYIYSARKQRKKKMDAETEFILRLRSLKIREMIDTGYQILVKLNSIFKCLKSNFISRSQFCLAKLVQK